jgi:hypothetical protein
MARPETIRMSDPQIRSLVKTIEILMACYRKTSTKPLNRAISAQSNMAELPGIGR